MKITHSVSAFTKKLFSRREKVYRSDSAHGKNSQALGKDNYLGSLSGSQNVHATGVKQSDIHGSPFGLTNCRTHPAPFGTPESTAEVTLPLGIEPGRARLNSVAPTPEISHDETIREAVFSAQAAVRGQIPLQVALAKINAALTQIPDSKKLLLSRALLRFDAQNAKGCVADCRMVLQIDPGNVLARLYEVAGLEIAKDVVGESLAQDAADTVEGRQYVNKLFPIRFAIVLSHAAYLGARTSIDGPEDVRNLYDENPSDRCVAALLALKYYDRWQRENDSNHGAEAYIIAHKMLKHWPLDRIAKSIIHHMSGLSGHVSTPLVEFASRRPFYGTTLYSHTFLNVDAVLDYPLRLLDPRAADNLLEYLTEHDTQ